MKHTPGPWRLSQTGNAVYIDNRRIPTIEIDSPTDACWVAQVQIHRSCITTPEGDANARLIAAAPELLEACRAAEAAITYDTPEAAEAGQWDLPMAVVILLRSAMFKAQGKE